MTSASQTKEPSRTGRPGHVWIDGRLAPADGAHVSVFDRGFQLGDGIFETLRARGGHPAELDAHIERLRRSAAGLAIELPPDIGTLVKGGIDEILGAEGLAGPTSDASVRITITRGPFFARGLLPTEETVAPTIAIQAWPVLPPPVDHLERGLHLVASAIRRDPENPLASLKTISRADYVHARLEARRAGADDALFLTIDGHLSEATSANLFLIRGGQLVTPDLACAILPGTTRSWIVVWGTRAGLDVAETWLTTRDLADADEAFLCSSVAGILPVTRFEGRAIGTGLPGPWTRRARADREAYIVAGDSAAAAAVERGEAANRAADAGQPAGRAAAEPRHVAGG